MRGEYDIFVPGQMPEDTNVILVDPFYSSTEDLAVGLAARWPGKKILYKRHPLDLSNVIVPADSNITVVSDVSIFECFKRCGEVHTISSTVGIEAALFGLPVRWHSLSPARDVDFSTFEDKCRFFNMALAYCCGRDDVKSAERDMGLHEEEN